MSVFIEYIGHETAQMERYTLAERAILGLLLTAQYANFLGIDHITDRTY